MPTKVIHRVAGLCLLASLLLGSTWAAYAHALDAAAQTTTSVTFTPVADAYVIKTYPSTNYGSSLTLRADASPVTRSYVRFVVSGLNGSTVQAAVIRFYANSSNSTGFSVQALANNTWGESSITYNNAPVPGSIINSSKSFKSGTWVSVDISSYVKSDATYSIVLTTSSSTNMKLSSREASGKAPQLVLTLVPAATATATASNLPTATSTAMPTPTSTATVTAMPTDTAIPADTSTPTDLPAPTATSSPVSTSSPMPSPTPTAQADWQPSFPIRAAFYYPWFPEAWTQQGIYPYTNYNPQLGFYSSSDSTILQEHISMMQYAGIQAGIASWWGQGSKSDSRIAGLLSAAAGTNFRWALYYEPEGQGDPTSTQIQNDLIYVHDHYGTDPNFLRVNGQFVVFVYADANDACGMADRWKQANTVGAYVVLKVFSGYRNCTSQPDDWHQYAPAVAEDSQGSYSISISPGFWKVGETPRLLRDISRWTQNVKDMVASTARWHLVTTFSEWGEGTSVEPALEWSSTSGYGQYLDVLHYNGNVP